MPHLVAMARAVLILSPVTMRTVMPALWHLEMASGTYRERGNDGVNRRIKRIRNKCCMNLYSQAVYHKSGTNRFASMKTRKLQADIKNEKGYYDKLRSSRAPKLLTGLRSVCCLVLCGVLGMSACL